jgi:alkylation response protein AidB-like acyl-CoA dehydrogenase
MDFNLTREEQAFRDEVGRFLDEHLLPEDQRDAAFHVEWQRKIREKRWVGFSWPAQYGGGGGSIMEQAILKEEMTKRKAPPLGTCVMGLQWVGPAIIEYGTEAQKKKFLPDILNAKYQWCTGYSEPGAGSDLASLQCRAVRDGDHYVVNGQKTWTSIAMWSKWIILLVRTSTNPDSKHDGITCLLVPMDCEGIEVRPIKNMAGHSIFAEVFFNEVRVPVENRLGEEGQGWKVTVSALAHERSGISELAGLVRRLDEIKELARRCQRNGRPASQDPGVRRRIAQAQTTIEAMRLNGLRYLTKQLKGEPLSSETSVNKLHRAMLEIGLGELALEIEGNASQYTAGSGESIDNGVWQSFSLSWPEVAIGGGTPNIQRNIIAERLLGLPKD